ncbi:MAG: hypothetical protein ISS81_05245 [Candidatus Marinimicrobia bacterium]|nr:hypothetical protein [Candidatus Neomarinimicrobiota bacterium]
MHTVSTDDKYNEVVDCIREAHYNTDKNIYHINFVSGERVPEETLFQTADKINSRIESYLKTPPGTWSNCGIIMLNYAGGSDSRDAAPYLGKTIIEKNNGVPY